MFLKCSPTKEPEKAAEAKAPEAVEVPPEEAPPANTPSNPPADGPADVPAPPETSAQTSETNGHASDLHDGAHDGKCFHFKTVPLRLLLIYVLLPLIRIYVVHVFFFFRKPAPRHEAGSHRTLFRKTSEWGGDCR